MDEVATAGARVVFDSESALEGAVSYWVVDSLEMSMNSEPHLSGSAGAGCVVWYTQSLDVVNVLFPHLSIIHGDGEGYWT